MTIKEKLLTLKKRLSSYENQEDLYLYIIEIGKQISNFSLKNFEEKDLVKGCQSKTYIRSDFQNGKVFFQGTSDALISRGLLALLFKLYNEELPENILKNPLNCFEELPLLQKLSYTRINGLEQIHLTLKREALKHALKT